MLAKDILANEEIISKLGQVPIFAGVGPGHLDDIAAKLSVVTVAPGETIFSEGVPGDSMNIVVRGLVSVNKGGRVLRNLGPWEIFGEMALVDASPRAAGASAVEQTTLLRLDRAAFFVLLRDRFELAVGMLNVLSSRLKESNVAIENLRDFLENRLLPLGAALSSEKKFDRLLARILSEAKVLCHADAGTIYVLQDGRLHFTLMFCDSLGIANGPIDGQKVAIPRSPPLALRDADDRPGISRT